MTPRPHLVLLPGLHGTDDLWPPLSAAIPPEFARTPIRYPTDEPLAGSGPVILGHGKLDAMSEYRPHSIRESLSRLVMQ